VIEKQHILCLGLHRRSTHRHLYSLLFCTIFSLLFCIGDPHNATLTTNTQTTIMLRRSTHRQHIPLALHDLAIDPSPTSTSCPAPAIDPSPTYTSCPACSGDRPIAYIYLLPSNGDRPIANIYLLPCTGDRPIADIRRVRRTLWCVLVIWAQSACALVCFGRLH
jgi:hypothetical protein